MESPDRNRCSSCFRTAFPARTAQRYGEKFFAHADTGVGDPEFQFYRIVVLGEQFRREINLSAIRGEFYRISDDVAENFLKAHFIGEEYRFFQRFCLSLDGNLFCLGGGIVAFRTSATMAFPAMACGTSFILPVSMRLQVKRVVDKAQR